MYHLATCWACVLDCKEGWTGFQPSIWWGNGIHCNKSKLNPSITRGSPNRTTRSTTWTCGEEFNARTSYNHRSIITYWSKKDIAANKGWIWNEGGSWGIDYYYVKKRLHCCTSEGTKGNNQWSIQASYHQRAINQWSMHASYHQEG